MISNVFAKMICTSLRELGKVFCLLVMWTNIANSQGLSEIVNVNWVFETANNLGENELNNLVIREVLVPTHWSGVEVLDGEAVWEEVDLDPELLTFTPTFSESWRIVRGMNSGDWLAQFRSPKFRRTASGGWERLISWTGIIGSSPLNMSRAVRVWPEHSTLSEGKWLRFSTGKKGFFKIGYTDLVESGVDPDTLNFAAMQLYGSGGRMLPFENDTDRPLDLPLLSVETEGEGDGIFNQGDAIYFHSSGVDVWKWNSSSESMQHDLHPWSDSAFYFLRLDGPVNLEGSRISNSVAIDLPILEELDSHTAMEFHELELYNIAKSGREFYGEHFTYLGAQVFGLSFDIPNLIGDTGRVDARVAGRTIGTTSTYKLTCNGGEATTQDLSLSENSLLIAQKRNLSVSVPMGGDGIAVEMSYIPGNESAEGWIDYVRVQARQSLVFSGGQFYINGSRTYSPTNSVRYTILNASTIDQIWDVTDPLTPIRCLLQDGLNNALMWKAPLDTTRQFVAFRQNSAKGVTVLGSVKNLDLHSLKNIDLVVITVPALDSAARRIATLHANDGLRVAVISQREVFDAFSSGSPDPTALKMLMMMLRDKADVLENEPKYLQLMGDGSYMNRNLDPDGINLLTFQSSNSESTVSSYVTDDYFGLLEDGFGESPGDKLAIGVGRIPAPTLYDALAFVSKVEVYLGENADSTGGAGCQVEGANTTFGAWRNRIIFVTDDQDGNNNDGWRHMSDSEVHSNRVSTDYKEYDIIKIYPDAYLQESTPGGERYYEAEAEINRKVEEGALIIDYIGHGGARGWAHERILNTTTIREWTNKRRLPVFMTATCELSRYDDPDTESAGEMLIFNPDGGAVGMLTTTRTVFSGGNQELNTAFFQTALNEDTGSGNFRCLGDICMDTKNSPFVTSVTNMRNFSLLGDPAMLLAYPKHRVWITEMPDTIRSLDVVTVRGYIGTEAGDTLNDFNGFLYPKVFDKRSQLSTLDNDNVAGPFSYTMFRNVIHKGLASVVNGAFEFTFVVPRDIDYTLGNGRISCYAVDDDEDAHGSFESFIIGGTSSNIELDDVGPIVELFLNDSLFIDGGMTNENPWLFARVFDESGINTVGNGIGHDLKAVLDGAYDSPFILNTYFASDLDTYKSGTVRFPFKGLEDGPHSLELKVWDVQNNSATTTTEFIVVNSFEVALDQILAYPNPAHEKVSFRISHNQACEPVDAAVEVFDMSGRKIKVFEMKLLANGNRTDVLEWDLRDGNGIDVSSGIYLFKIRLTTENGASAQYGSKLVVVKP